MFINRSCSIIFIHFLEEIIPILSCLDFLPSVAGAQLSSLNLLSPSSLESLASPLCRVPLCRVVQEIQRHLTEITPFPSTTKAYHLVLPTVQSCVGLDHSTASYPCFAEAKTILFMVSYCPMGSFIGFYLYVSCIGTQIDF